MKKIFFLLTLVSMFNGFAQETTVQTKSKLSLKVGLEYRITPIYPLNSDSPIQLTAFYNLDEQLSGTSVNYSINYMLFKKFDIGFSQSFRYDHIYFKNIIKDLYPNTTIGLGEGESVNGWITDYHLFATSYFTIKDYDFFIRGGISLMNRGTAYSQTIYLGTNSLGSARYRSDNLNFAFSALNLKIGYVYNKFELGIGAYFINGTGANFQKEDNIILPNFNISYRLGK